MAHKVRENTVFYEGQRVRIVNGTALDGMLGTLLYVPENERSNKPRAGCWRVHVDGRGNDFVFRSHELEPA